MTRISAKQIQNLETLIRFDLPEFRMVERNAAGGCNKPYMKHNGIRTEFKTNTELFEAALDIISELL